MEPLTLRPIGHMESDFSEKFGIPRQSGLVEDLRARVVLEPEYRNPDAFRGIEGFSHLWLIWEFSQARREGWSPTVRPPRLGGNERVGVFATRSPFRPNPIGLSCVRLEGVEWDAPDGPALAVAGADLLDGTPILDIKPMCPTPTVSRRPWRALPSGLPAPPWRWTSRRTCWPVCRRTSGPPSPGCWPRTPALGISTTRSGSTACPSPDWRSGSGWRGQN